MRWLAGVHHSSPRIAAAALGFSLILVARSPAQFEPFGDDTNLRAARVSQITQGTQFAPIPDDGTNVPREGYSIDRIFQNAAQREIFGMYQSANPQYSGPNYNPFGSDGGRTISGVKISAGPYTGFSEPTPVPYAQAGGPGAAWDLVAPTRYYEEMYGGFGRHGASYTASTMTEVLRRKPSMWAAYAGQMPIARAKARVADTEGPAAKLGGRNAPMGQQLPEATESDVTLGQQWEGRLRNAGSRKIFEAWGYFNKGNYRAAARAFETAQSLVPKNTAAGVGELFCYVALGSRGTLNTSLQQFVQRVENPFVATINLTELFSSTQEADRIRTLVQQIALENASSNEARALQTLMLWYYGERDGAIATAATLAGSGGEGSPYARWPSLMQSTRRAIMARPQG